MVEFSVEGPFDLDLSKLDPLDKKSLSIWKKNLFESLRSDHYDFSAAKGVYIYCNKYGRKLTPWYVGKCVSRSGFKGEILTNHKLDVVKKLKTLKGTSLLVLFVVRTKKGGKPSTATTGAPKGAIELLEKLFILEALKKNSKLVNRHQAALASNIHVPGLFGTDPPGPKSKQAKLATEVLR
jgi:hypothetical protein